MVHTATPKRKGNLAKPGRLPRSEDGWQRPMTWADRGNSPLVPHRAG
ncbi:hypothetical protein RR42_m4185 [Cupriavidus basilensis]|uniref:Uncharacterized protein n=1 Tax=Cupriavidus basilensis TaxID=68895 RepID=A0A0C4Y7Y3_9BURK|nr:hypothetical protein RR42_m4185 [Cupriavidus basilensis]